MATEKRKRILTKFRVLLFIGIALSVTILLVPLAIWAYSDICQNWCMHNQKHIALALFNYEDVYGQLPPTYKVDENGNPLYSWRLLVMQMIEEGYLDGQFHYDESWNSPHNKKLSPTFSLFYCPSSAASKFGMTNYVLVTGPGTIWDGNKPCSLDDISYRDQTLMMIEVAEPGIHWAEPKDLKIDDIDPRFLDENGNFKANHPGHVVATFADGHVEFLAEEEVLDALKKRSQIKQDKKEE